MSIKQTEIGTVTASRCHSTDISCKTGFIYFYPLEIFDMDVKNVNGGILIFIRRDRIFVTKILNISHNDNKA
jgi:hypothetical protein